jgi:hypothetical protein
MIDQIKKHYAVICLFVIGGAVALGVATLNGCAKKADAQEVEQVEQVETAQSVMPPIVGHAEQVETFDVEVTRWEPVTHIETRTRRRALPIFQTERRQEFQRGDDWVEDKIETEIADGSTKILSVPRVIKETKNMRGKTFRRVERMDNFVAVDGFTGTGEVSTQVMPAGKPTDGFGGVQVGLLNRNNQPWSNAVIDQDDNVRFNGDNAQRLNSVQADVDGDFGSSESEAQQNNGGRLRGLLGKNKNRRSGLFGR